MDEPKDNPAENRYEMNVDGHLAVLTYRRDGNRLVLLHTEVPQELGGRGVGSRLVGGALRDARGRGLTVEPRCTFVSAWLKKNPEWHDIVAPGSGG